MSIPSRLNYRLRYKILRLHDCRPTTLFTQQRANTGSLNYSKERDCENYRNSHASIISAVDEEICRGSWKKEFLVIDMSKLHLYLLLTLLQLEVFIFKNVAAVNCRFTIEKLWIFPKDFRYVTSYFRIAADKDLVLLGKVENFESILLT